MERWRWALEGAMVASRAGDGRVGPPTAALVAGTSKSGDDANDAAASIAIALPFVLEEEEEGLLLASEALRRVEGVDDLVTAFELRWLQAALAGVSCCFLGRGVVGGEE